MFLERRDSSRVLRHGAYALVLRVKSLETIDFDERNYFFTSVNSWLESQKSLY